MSMGSTSLDDFKSVIKYEEGLLMELNRREKASNKKFGHSFFKKRLLGIRFFNQCDKIEETRNILLVGQPLPPLSRDMYFDIIKLELKNHMTNGVERRLKIYVDDMVKNKFSHELLMVLVTMFKNIPLMENFADYVIEQMLCHYRHQPRVWHFVAIQELKGKYYLENRDTKSISYCIERSVACYKQGILELPSEKKSVLWKLYLKTLVTMQKQYTTRQTTSLLMAAFDRAAASEIEISKSQYLAWIDCCGENHEVLVKTFEEGVKNVSESVSIWGRYVKHYLLQDETELAKTVFDRAIIALGPNSIRLWQLYINFPMLGIATIDMDYLYECAMSQPYPEVAILFKPFYLDWTIRVKGIEAGRRLYLKIAPRPPYVEILHREMMRGEYVNDQNRVNRQIQQLVTEQFGIDAFSRITFGQHQG